jgi:hypothetical protein
MKLLLDTIFIQCCWRQKLTKRELQWLKQDQLKLKKKKAKPRRQINHVSS